MTTERKLAIGAMLASATGIVIQIAGGADYPTVPPGLLIFLAAAGLFAVRNRYANSVALLATIAISIGGVLTPNIRDQLSAPSDTLVFLGTALQTPAMLAGLVFGFATVVRQGPRKRVAA